MSGVFCSAAAELGLWWWRRRGVPVRREPSRSPWPERGSCWDAAGSNRAPSGAGMGWWGLQGWAQPPESSP